MMTKRVWLLCLLLWTLGCAEVDSFETEEPPEADHRGLPALVFSSSEAVAEVFSREVVRFEQERPFRQVGLRIDAEDVSAFEFRARGTDEHWTDWQPVDVYFSEGSIHNGLIIVGEAATAVELRGLQDVSFAFAEFSESVIARRDLVRSAEVIRPAPQEVRSLAQAVAPADLVISRHGWQAIDPDKICGSVVAPYRMAIHHTAGPNNETDPHARMRSIQSFHINSRGWCDIGYHFVVAPTGEIFQGRSRSNRPGAHVGNHNSGNVGISMMGTYTSVSPPEAQLEGVTRMVRWVHDTHGVELNRQRVLGHREHSGASTECPGTVGVTYLDSIVDGARAMKPAFFGVALEIEVRGLEDFYAQGTSLDVPDALQGERFQVDVYVTNQSEEPIRGVELGYRFDEVGLAPVRYRIETDAPNFDRSTFVLNDANDAEENPPHEAMGSEGVLTMYAFAAGETKRVVIEFEAGHYNLGLTDFSGVGVFLRNINDLYVQESFEAEPSRNEFETALRVQARIDVLSQAEWQFRGAGPDDLEGWEAADAAADVAVNTAEQALEKHLVRAEAALRSPAWTAVDGEEFDEMVVRLRLPEGTREMGLFWRGAEEEFSSQREVRFLVESDGEYQTLVVALGQHAGWQGLVEQLILVLNGEAPALDGEEQRVFIDHLYFQNRGSAATSSQTLGVVDVAPVTFLPGSGADGPGSTRPEIGRLVTLRQDDDFDTAYGCAASTTSTTPSPSAALLVLIVLGFCGWRRRQAEA